MGGGVRGRRGGGWGWGGQRPVIHTLFFYSQASIFGAVYVFFIRSSHHLNRHIHVVHLFGKDGDMFVCFFCGE